MYFSLLWHLFLFFFFLTTKPHQFWVSKLWELTGTLDFIELEVACFFKMARII